MLYNSVKGKVPVPIHNSTIWGSSSDWCMCSQLLDVAGLLETHDLWEILVRQPPCLPWNSLLTLFEPPHGCRHTHSVASRVVISAGPATAVWVCSFSPPETWQITFVAFHLVTGIVEGVPCPECKPALSVPCLRVFLLLQFSDRVQLPAFSVTVL